MRRPAVPTILASAALFVALGGPAEAARLISGSQIRSSSITGKQVKSRSLSLSDLSVATRRSLTATPRNTVGAVQLQEGAVTAPKLAAGSVTGAAIADGTIGAQELLPSAIGSPALVDGGVGTADLSDGAVTRGKLAAGAIDGSKVQDAGLTGRDVGAYAGRLTDLDFGTVAAGTCAVASTTSLTALVQGQDLRDDAITVTPESTFPVDRVSVTVRAAGSDRLEVGTCNPTAAPVVVGKQNFRFLTIDVGS